MAHVKGRGAWGAGVEPPTLARFFPPAFRVRLHRRTVPRQLAPMPRLPAPASALPFPSPPPPNRLVLALGPASQRRTEGREEQRGNRAAFPARAEHLASSGWAALKFMLVYLRGGKRTTYPCLIFVTWYPGALGGRGVGGWGWSHLGGMIEVAVCLPRSWQGSTEPCPPGPEG